MTKEAIRRLIQEAADTEALEEALREEIAESLDYEAIAYEILRRYEEEINELAADVLAECLLPF